MEKCDNCEREIGKLEKAYAVGKSVVCQECQVRLLNAPNFPPPPPPQTYAQPAAPFKALGLTSTGQAVSVFIVGLLLTPALIGIPLIIWGILAEHQLRAEARRRR